MPGIGAATAASIAAFAFNAPTLFAETNIKIVFIHFFLSEKENICDKEILDLVAQTIDRSAPRIWYYALTDYGNMLKSKGINPINKSKSYTKQSRFEGSDRQIRGTIIKLLLNNKKQSIGQLCNILQKSFKAAPERTKRIIKALEDEKLVTKIRTGNSSHYTIMT